MDVPAPPGREILRLKSGSHLRGVNTENSDTDLLGVCIEPSNAVFGLQRFEQFIWRSAEGDDTPSGPEDVDYTCYGLKKFLNLATQGNPNILEVMHAPHSCFEFLSETGKELLDMHTHATAYNCKGRFLGYLHGQRQKAIHRKTDDPKLLAHMVRLGYQAVELLGSGSLTLPLQGIAREHYLGVRHEQIPPADALAIAKELEEQASEIKQDHTPLPAKPDINHIENWMHGVYLWEFIHD